MSAVRDWAADILLGGVSPYMLLSVEADNDQYTHEYYLVIGSDDSDIQTFYDVTVYQYIEHYTVNQWGGWELQYITTAKATSPQMVIDTQQYICYSSFDGFPHLREEVFSDAAFAQSCSSYALLLSALLILDAVKMFRSRLGGGSA